LAMTLAQGLTAVIVFWAIVGGLGASLLLPSMQSLVHGNFEGAAQRKAYALVGASAAIAAARRLSPRPRRRATPAGLAAFEDAPCYQETLEREERESR
ncbi:MAG TPA: hypothetical protein VIU44_11745, partial [Gaiellaceae bacterium]